MSIDRALQWTTAAVAVVGALFLALGHESGWLPALLAVAAAVSVLVTDLIPRLRLNRIVGNLIAVAAVAWSLYDFLDRSSDQQLMAISQMLVILQVLLLFQEKTGRSYWQLLVLSLLQVVVAAALNSGVEFGLLLAVYMVLSLLALVLLCMHHDLQVDRPSSGAVEPIPTSPCSALLARPQTAPATNASRAAVSPLGSRLLLRQLVILTLATTGLTAVFFYMTPRLSDSSWRSQRKDGSTISGVSQQIELEEFGRIHQSNQVVLRVSFSHAVDRSPYTMIGEPYFQGGVLTQYEREDGKSSWAYVPRQAVDRYNGPSDVWRGNEARAVVRQDCMLELVNSPIAFAVFPLRWPRGAAPADLRLERSAGRIIRANSDVRSSLGEVRYAGLTTALQHGRQLRAISHANSAADFTQASDLKEELDGLLEFDADRFPGLAAVAQQVLRDAEADADAKDPLARALALERHFLFSNQYHYALNLDFQRDGKLDPIEDFVVNHRTGHCEYFASALVLMLRSQGIPARIAIGYKGGEFNMLGQYFVVRQKHAHAWVEAYMPPDAVPKAEIAGAVHAGGCWYRLDPTPASNQHLATVPGASFQDQVTDAFDYLELMWRDYVVNLNSFRQHQAVIDPGAANAIDALPDWIDSRSADRWLRSIGQRLGFDMRRRTAREQRYFDWRLVAAVAGGMAIVIGVAQLGALVLRRLSHWLGWRRDPRAAFHRPPAFYSRLERLLARMRLSRAEGQTAAELAEAARSKLAGGEGPAGAAQLPAAVVAAYYRVRFGGDALDNSESAAIEHALDQLVPAVSQVQKR
jgi:protein-glutamine gamma-glutamyltransferase